MTDRRDMEIVQGVKDLDDIPASPGAGATFVDLVAERLSRRDLVGGLLAASALAAVLPPAAGPAGAQPVTTTTPSFDFAEVAAGVDDKAYVAADHEASVLIRWGDKVLPDAPVFDPLKQTAAAQARQFGYNNDFIGYIPIDGSSEHGLLVVNHEYTNEELMFPGVGIQRGKGFPLMTRALSDIEMMAHGGSIIEVRRTGGAWAVAGESRLNRRITAETEMRVSGPAAGHELMRTRADPTGSWVRGMLGNCAGGITPWGTWLTCEENINAYFRGKTSGLPYEHALRRYSIPSNWQNWGAYHERFDLGREPNEANRFGWIVEIDPTDPASVPVKRTALGRFKHEGAGNVVNRDGRFVVYSGDDQRFDYVYKFVTAGVVDRTDRAANRDLLDHGTLYVARFAADGTGEWLALVHGQDKLVAPQFADQGHVLIHARLAADELGATRMDRPEDIEVDPRSGKVYLMLTNNHLRKPEEVDAVNPRAENHFGHIVEIEPEGGDHAATRFRWEILVRCGDPGVAAVGATFNPATSREGWFGMPDNALADAAGRLWIATDGNSQRATGRTDGLWAIETAGKARGTARLFYRCPIGAELCGPMMTPDMTTMFVSVQHPGEGRGLDGRGSTFDAPSTRWPDFQSGMPPRPAVVAITRRGGGRVG